MSLLLKHQKISKSLFHESCERQEEVSGENVYDNFPAFRKNKQINQLAIPKENVECTKMLLRFREENIKRLELLTNGMISTDHYLMDENNALMEEIQQLRARIHRNSQVTRLQDCYERGEREALLAEVLMLHDQLVKTLEVEESYVEKNFTTEREIEDEKASMELEQYKCANSKLIRLPIRLGSAIMKAEEISVTQFVEVQNLGIP